MIIIQVKIVPKSKCNEIIGYENDILKIRIKAAPEKNKANKELIYFLAKKLSIPQSNIIILSGETCRIKKIKIEKITSDEFNKLIEN